MCVPTMFAPKVLLAMLKIDSFGSTSKMSLAYTMRKMSKLVTVGRGQASAQHEQQQKKTHSGTVFCIICMHITYVLRSKLFGRPEHQLESTVNALFANTVLIPTFLLFKQLYTFK